MYDVIIIGLGPAGISAALYTVRANMKTLVIGRNDSALGKASKIENYFGFSEPVSGEFLLSEGQKQIMRLGTEVVEDEVISVEKKDFFEVRTSGHLYSGKAVLLATGRQQKKLKLHGIEEFEGRGVSYCTTCDGFFYNNLKVGVLGYKDYAIHEASELLTFTRDITIFTDGMKTDISKEFREAAEGFKFNDRKLKGLGGSEFLERVFFQDGTSEPLDGLFIAYESASSLDFARKLGIIVDGGAIVADRYQQTNLEGLFAAGDCTGGFRQISTAVGQGAMAGKKMIEYVKSL